MKNKKEIDSFDHNDNPRAFWDEDGKVYVTEDDKVFIVEQGVCLKQVFDVTEVNQKQKGKKD